MKIMAEGIARFSKKCFPSNREVSRHISEIYQKVFYVSAETKMMGVKGVAKYIGCYLDRLIIAEYRITNYAGNTVEF